MKLETNHSHSILKEQWQQKMEVLFFQGCFKIFKKWNESKRNVNSKNSEAYIDKVQKPFAYRLDTDLGRRACKRDKIKKKYNGYK